MSTIETTVKQLNKARLSNKNQWYSVAGMFGPYYVRYKAFNTSIQILDIDGIHHNSTFDLSVKDFKEALTSAFEYAKKNKQ